MSASLVSQQPGLLTSWKEIASYLGKGVRTVQRWEQDYGLPVRRPNHKDKGVVHATKDELDHWLSDQWTQREKELVRPNPFDAERIEAVRAGIRRSTELRASNRLLITQIRRSLETMFAECRTLAGCMARTASHS